MKNNIQLLIATCFIALSTSALYAQKNAAKFIMEVPGRFSFGYERAYSPKNTLMLEYQKWDQSSTKSVSGLLFSDVTNTKITGYRMELVARHYRKSAMKGGFLEGGFYVGKHDVTIVHKTSSFNPVAIFFFKFDKVSKSSSDRRAYKSVAVGGGKIGGGYHITIGHFSMEGSAGLNINAMNSKNVRPVLPLKGAAPYGRIALGVAF
jgi:hypothetical protein